MAEIDKLYKDEYGNIAIRWRKEDGGWHRAVIEPTQDFDMILNAIDTHLKAELKDTVGVKTSDRERIKEKKPKEIKEISEIRDI